MYLESMDCFLCIHGKKGVLITYNKSQHLPEE